MTHGEMLATEVAYEGKEILSVLLGIEEKNVLLAQELDLSLCKERTAKFRSGSRTITVTITEPKTLKPMGVA